MSRLRMKPSRAGTSIVVMALLAGLFSAGAAVFEPDAAAAATLSPAVDAATTEAARATSSSLEGKTRSSFGAEPVALTVPGQPGTPQPGDVIYTEDFENGQTGPLLSVDTYVGAQGQPVDADATYSDWTQCNGWIPSWDQPAPSWPTVQCSPTQAGSEQWVSILKSLGVVLGEHNGDAAPAANHVVVDGTNPKPDVDYTGVLLESSDITLPSAGRFVTFAVDTAEYAFCAPEATNAQDTFELLDGATAVPLSSTPYSLCTDPDAQTAQGPEPTAPEARVGTFTGDRAFFLTSPTVGYRITNAQPSGSGNDQAFDNFRILDVTPQLDKAFSPASVPVGGTSTITFTVTNTDELAAKPGWSFTDELPDGLKIADPNGATSTCSGSTITAAAGDTTIEIEGDLDAGQTSCAVTVDVSSTTVGTYENCPDINVTDLVGLNAPACASVEFVEVAAPPSVCNVAPNGSFEDPNIEGNPDSALTPEGYASFLTNQATISGWSVVSGTVDILRWYSNASEGAQSIDMYGVSPGVLEQTFTGLVPGAEYTFGLDYSGRDTVTSAGTVSLANGGALAPVQTLTPAANAVVGGTPPTQPSSIVTWAPFTHTFTAAATSATIRIANAATPGPGGTGLFVDNFSFDGPCTDFGDAPRIYDTQSVDDGARHLIEGYDATASTGDLMLGSMIDNEADGPFAGGAITDDITGAADEDGIAAPIDYDINTSETVEVAYTNDTGAEATLAGWIDLDRNGVFDSGERQTVPVPTGTGTVDVTFPALGGVGNTYSRFRLFPGTVADPSPTGLVLGGEVEDHRVFGPPTVLTCDGAPNGSFEEPEVVGNPDSYESPAGFALWLTNQSTLNGWNITEGSLDILQGYNNASDGDQSIDLWGVSPGTIEQSFTGLMAGQEYTFSLDYSGLSTTGSVATVSLDTGGGFADLETLTPVADATPGTPPGTPLNIVTWATYTHTFTATSTDASIRIANRVDPGPFNTGLFIDNFQMIAPGCDVLDLGDAPDSYGTTLASDGPRHTMPGYDADAGTASVMLGSSIGDETDGQPNAAADGDGADEDGVEFNPVLGYPNPTLRTGLDANTQQPVENTLEVDASADGFVSVWVDWNQDGDFLDAGEQVANAQAVTAGTNDVTFSQGTNPAGIESYVRVRYSTDAASIATPTGAAPDGEVEDYRVLFERLIQPDACVVSSETYYAFTFSQPVNLTGNGSVGSTALFQNVAVVDGVAVDMLAEVVAGSNSISQFPPNGFIVTVNGGDDAGWLIQFDSTIRYSFLEAGTTTPVDINGVFTVTDMDDIESATFSAGDLASYAVTEGSAVAIMEAGGSVTFDGVGNWTQDPESRFQFVLEGTNTFDVRWQGGGNSGFAFDGDGDFSIDPPACSDFGDAPNSFGTDLTSNGPRHTVTPGLSIGDEIDFDPNGQPTPTADGDDGDRIADEDAFSSPLILNPGVTSTTVTVPVTNSTGGAATLYGWIDANGNGSFEASEFASIPVPDGATTVDLAFNGISALQDGATPVVRLRLTTDALADDAGTANVDERALGAASNGEVEDHQAHVATQVPLSCVAPFIETFGTGAGWGPALPAGQTTYTYANSRDGSGFLPGGAYGVVPSPSLAHVAWMSGEDHTSDDVDGRMMVVNAAEEPGLFFQRTFTGLAPGASYDFSAWLANVLNAAVQDFPNVTFRVVDPATGNELAQVNTGNVPSSSTVTWQRYALQFEAVSPTVRLELVNNTPHSSGNDLAIDDITFMPVCEFGDAPSSYGTLIGDNGAGHIATGPTLGSERDTESDGQPDATANGDDSAGVSDEDGISSPIGASVGSTTTVTVSATNDSDEDVTLAGWIDLDGNGAFDSAERVLVTVPANSGTDDYDLVFPVMTTTADTYARFRIYGEVVADPQPTGTAAAGEVEDYPVTVLEPTLEIEKISDMTEDSRPGDTITYTVTATNSGAGDYTASNPAVVLDDLSGVLDDATYQNDAAAEASDGSTVTDPAFLAPSYLSWSSPIAAGESVEITYTVTLAAGGDGTVRNVAWQPTTPPELGVPPVDVPECDPPTAEGTDPTTGEPCATSEGLLPKLTVVKTSDVTDLPADGGTVTYTVTVANAGPGDFTAAAPASSNDDLSAVLDDATFGNILEPATGASFDSSTQELSWSSPLDAGDSVDIVYTVTYDADAEDGDHVLLNTACAAEDDALDPDGNCDFVQIPAAALVMDKTVDPADGTTVNAGQTVTYTLNFQNVGQSPATVDALDDLSGVLDDATIGTITADTGLSAAQNGDELEITGQVPVGATLTVTYTVTVDAFAVQADHVLGNVLSNGDGSCPPRRMPGNREPDPALQCGEGRRPGDRCDAGRHGDLHGDRDQRRRGRLHLHRSGIGERRHDGRPRRCHLRRRRRGDGIRWLADPGSVVRGSGPDLVGPALGG